MRRAVLLVAGIVALAPASTAKAEIALLSNGQMLKVEAWGSVNGSLHLKLKGGGEVGVPAST